MATPTAIFYAEAKAKMSAWQIGRKMSEESRAKMSMAAKARWTQQRGA